MKKLLIVLLALTVVGVFAFADDAAAPAAAAPVVTIGDWGKQIFAIGNTDNNSGSGYQAGLGTSWGSNPRIVGLQISAHNDNAGFAISPCADNGSFGLTDENKAWVSPLAGLTFESGLTLETDTWRGITDYASDDWIRYNGVVVSGNTTTFARLGEGGFMSDLNYNKDGIGAWIGIENATSATTITASTVGAGASSTATTSTINGSTGGGNSAAVTNLSKAIQAGAAYTIAGIGTIKAQYLGMSVNGATFLGNPSGANIINAAFNLSAVKDLYEEVGVIIPTTDVGYNFALGEDIGCTIAPLALHARLEAVNFDGNSNMVSSLGLTGNVAVDYDLGNGVGAEAAVDYSNSAAVSSGANTSATALTGILVDIKKSFSNGWIGVGFQYSTIGFEGTDFSTSNAYSHWAIPITVSEWF